MAKEYTKKAQKEQQDLAKWQGVFAKIERKKKQKPILKRKYINWLLQKAVW